MPQDFEASSFSRESESGVDMVVSPTHWPPLPARNISLPAGRSGDQTASVQTGPGARAFSYTEGTEPFPGVTRRGCGVDRPSLPRA